MMEAGVIAPMTPRRQRCMWMAVVVRGVISGGRLPAGDDLRGIRLGSRDGCPEADSSARVVA